VDRCRARRWATFSNARLSLSRLDHANCAHIDLTDASELDSATGACFDNAVAMRWSAREANLTGASFRDADLRDADFTDAVLVDCDLTGANLTGAKLAGADLTGAKGVNQP